VLIAFEALTVIAGGWCWEPDDLWERIITFDDWEFTASSGRAPVGVILDADHPPREDWCHEVPPSAEYQAAGNSDVGMKSCMRLFE
jgi:hypothetical protein